MKRLALIAVGVWLAGCAPKTDTIANTEPVAPETPQPAATVAPAPTPAPAPIAAPTPPADKPAPVTVPTPPPGPNPAAIPDTSPSVGPPPATAPAVIAAPPAREVPIFETVKDGKTYVFVSIAAMNAFTTSGTQQPLVSEKPNWTGNGATVVIEAADEAQAREMIASYARLHPPLGK